MKNFQELSNVHFKFNMLKKAKIVKNKKKFPWGKIWYYIKKCFKILIF